MKNLTAYRMKPTDHPMLVERLRKLYVEALSHLATKRLPTRTELEQQLWFSDLDHEATTIHLYSPVGRPWEIVGFSMVTDRGTFCTPMFSLTFHMRGQGLGEEIIQHYLAIANGKPLHGEQLVANGAICHLNEKLGWKVKHDAEGVQYLYHPNGTDYPQSAYDEIVRYHEENR